MIITRERLLEIIVTGPEASGAEQNELARMALVAMDSEPVAEITEDLGRLFVKIHYPTTLIAGDKLYRHSQPAPVVPEEKSIPNTLSMYAVDAVAAIAEVKGWNACRAAMLQAGTLTNEDTKQAWTGIPDTDNAINMLDRIDTLESCDDDRIEAVKTVLRGLAGNSPVIPDSSADMLRRWLTFGRGMQNAGSQLPHNLIAETESMLAAAPQSPGSEPATVPGKWIPVSEQKPDCWCRTCRPVTLNDMRFVVCPDCGNKRCPRANDHRNACTRSNEPGQEGSAYPAAPQEVRGE
ncbi:TPA: hypothetical protein ACIJT3_002183 [Klebsiella pneumoniae]